MSQRATGHNVNNPNCLDSSPVFFTGLSNKKMNMKALETSCKLCNRRINDNAVGKLCSGCRAMPYMISKKSSSDRYSLPNSTVNGDIKECSMPSTSVQNSSDVNENRTSLLPSPVLNSSLNSSHQNDLIEASIQSLLNSDIKAMLDSLQTPKHEKSNFKSKSSYRERQEERTKASPYSHSPSPNQDMRHKNPSYFPTQTPKNVRFPLENGSGGRFKTSPSFGWSPSQASVQTNQLSGEMWKLYHQTKQTEDVRCRKMILRDTLHDILRTKFDCALYVVGSSMNGFGANNSDVDMCLMLSDSEIDQQKEALTILQDVRKLFRNYKFLNKIQLIPAKVPILKFVDSVSRVEVDLNINNTIGIRNTQLLSSYSRIDRRVSPLIVLIKLWASHHDINDAKNMSLSSYSIALMVIHYLQFRCQPPVVPCLQSFQPDKYLSNTDVRKLKPYEDLPEFKSENRKDLGDLFIGFLDYYANEFNFYDCVISVRLGQLLPKSVVKRNSTPKNKPGQWQYVCIEEPFDLSNTARSVFNENVFQRIHFVFHESWSRLMKNPDLYAVLC